MSAVFKWGQKELVMHGSNFLNFETDQGKKVNIFYCYEGNSQQSIEFRLDTLQIFSLWGKY